jgi:hypothetical protein
LNRALIDRGVTALAVIALSLWVGGIVALGACAAPIVFGAVPAPLSGEAMGAVFHRFDAVAIACAVVVLGCEAARMLIEPLGGALVSRVRSASAVAMAAAAVYQGTVLSPAILALHAAGAVRGFGDDGLALEHLHRLATTSAGFQAMLGMLLLVLQVITVNGGAREEAP